MCLFFFHSQNPFFLYFDKCGWWHADSFLIEEQKLTTHCYSHILLPFRVFQTPFTWYAFSPTGLKTRGYSPSASRLSDASFLSHDYQSRLEDADFQARGIWKFPSPKPSGRREMNSRRAFKPPGWNQTQHIMASEKRGLSSPWNMEVSIIKVVWKTGNLNSRWAFKPPDWIRTLHTMASGRREVK